MSATGSARAWKWPAKSCAPGTGSPFSPTGSNFSVVFGPSGVRKLGTGSVSLFVLLLAPMPRPRLAKTRHIAVRLAPPFRTASAAK